MTGRCLCPPGKMGTRCDTNCPVNRYGPDCSESCECRNGAWCDPRNGRCTCLQGWIGPTCQEGGSLTSPQLGNRNQENNHSHIVPV
ncbi:hypothetical protein J4Q44_G00256000 [Coregonus suidteri]|uniref:EGF-like domain-containing protein n=1 Tax=Coregonus suidteri TaxID=861788 RepID=A0AAN8LGH3_9TELE